MQTNVLTACLCCGLAQSMVIDAVDGLSARGIPTDLYVIDYFNWAKMGDYTFNPKMWPDPAAMVQHLASKGVRLMVSAWPYTLKDGARASSEIVKPGTDRAEQRTALYIPGPSSLCWLLFIYLDRETPLHDVTPLAFIAKLAFIIDFIMIVRRRLAAATAGNGVHFPNGSMTPWPDGVCGGMCYLYDPTSQSGRDFVWDMLDTGCVRVRTFFSTHCCTEMMLANRST